MLVRDFRAHGTVTGLKEVRRVGIPSTAEAWRSKRASLSEEEILEEMQ